MNINQIYDDLDKRGLIGNDEDIIQKKDMVNDWRVMTFHPQLINFGNLTQKQQRIIKSLVSKYEKLRTNSAAAAAAIHQYSDEVKYYLELIQNAEDNKYGPGIKGELQFIYNDDRLLVRNNETGFTQENMQKISDVFATSKVNKGEGYIGEKGIGFKSVFLISKSPRIYSNGFNFCFEYNDSEPITIAEPIWLDDIPQEIDRNQTNILLPLKDEAKNQIHNLINLIDPRLMLFLRNLHVLQVHDQINSKKAVITRSVKGDRVNLSHILNANKPVNEFWLTIYNRIEVPKGIYEPKRENIKTTKIILAFPLDLKGKAETHKSQEVFNYLPIKSYGNFKFIIQGDFLLNLARTAIDPGKSGWNELIRAQIAPTFICAVDRFKKDDLLKYNFYNYLPDGKLEDYDWFSEAVKEIRGLLTKYECILTTSGQWSKPDDVYFIKRGDSAIRKIVTNDELQRLQHKEYVHPDIHSSNELLASIGVKEFTVDTLIDCLSILTLENDKHGIQWYRNLYSYLAGIANSLNLTQINKLKKLRIILLENNTAVSIQEYVVSGGIFLPLQTDYGFEHRVPIVNKSIMNSKSKTRISDLLKKLSVMEPEHYRIIENYIIPGIYENDAWQTDAYPLKDLIPPIRYIKDNINKYIFDKKITLGGQVSEQKVLERLINSIRLQTTTKNANGETIFASPAEMYFSEEYLGTNYLKQLFDGIQGISFLDTIYISDYIVKRDKLTNKRSIKYKNIIRDITEWRDFFKILGVSDGFKVSKIDTPYIQPTDLRKKNTSWTNQDGFQHFGVSDATYKDWSVDNLEEILTYIKQHFTANKKGARNKIQALITVLSKQWETLRKQDQHQYKYSWKYRRSDYGPVLGDASWLMLLKSAAFLPFGNVANLEKPINLFLDTTENRENLGDAVCYLEKSLTKNVSLLFALGVHKEADAEGIISVIKKLAGENKTNTARMRSLYTILFKKARGAEIKVQMEFTNNRLIYYPKIKQYYKSEEVFWTAPNEKLINSFKCLEKHYPGLENLFRMIIAVNKEPAAEDYMHLLKEIVETSSSEVRNVKPLEEMSMEELQAAIARLEGSDSNVDELLVFEIYKQFERVLSSKDDSVATTGWWTESIKEDEIFWVDKREFWRNEGNIYVNDNPELTESVDLSTNSDIAFIKLPDENSYPSVKLFCETVGIKPISQTIVSKVLHDNHRDWATRKPDFYTLYEYFLRYKYKTDTDTYRKMSMNISRCIINQYSIMLVDNLRVQYFFNASELKTQNKQAYYNKDDNTLYIDADHKYDTLDLSSELSSLWTGRPDSSVFIEEVLLKFIDTPSSLKSYFDERKISELPSDEKAIFKERIRTILDKTKETDPDHKKLKNVEPPPEAVVPETPQVGSEYRTDPVTTPVKTRKNVESELIDGLKSEVILAPSKFETTEYIPIIDPTIAFGIRIGKQGNASTADQKSTSLKLNDKDRIKIAETGEKRVFDKLKYDFRSKYGLLGKENADGKFEIVVKGKVEVEITWLNCNGDISEGRDIDITIGDEKRYIEVKSTHADDLNNFEITGNQWKCAQRFLHKYEIWRVYSALDSDRARSVIIKNPFSLFQEGKLDARPVEITI